MQAKVLIMSKYPFGRYDTGEIRYKYFRKNKHHYRTLMRKVMWIASCWKKESAFNHQESLYNEHRKSTVQETGAFCD